MVCPFSPNEINDEVALTKQKVMFDRNARWARGVNQRDPAVSNFYASSTLQLD